MAKKRNKSDSYQYKIVEITVDPTILNDFSSINGLGAQLNISKCSEEFYELKEKLMDEICKIIDNNLTKRQAEVVKLRLKGNTQIQIAEELGVHQTTIHKLISGNIDYANGKKRYGGALKKIKKHCFKNSTVLEILKKIDDLKKLQSI